MRTHSLVLALTCLVCSLWIVPGTTPAAQENWAESTPFGAVSFQEEEEVEAAALVAARALRASTGEVLLLREVWRNFYMDYSCYPENRNGPWSKFSLEVGPTESFATVLDKLNEQTDHLRWSFNEKYSVIHLVDIRLLNLPTWPLNQEIDAAGLESLAIRDAKSLLKQKYALDWLFGLPDVSPSDEVLGDFAEPKITLRELVMKALPHYRSAEGNWFEVFVTPEICNGFAEVKARKELGWAFWGLNPSTTIGK
jgi:hypothetical protein